jgi:hypothetical protein
MIDLLIELLTRIRILEFDNFILRRENEHLRQRVADLDWELLGY